MHRLSLPGVLAATFLAVAGLSAPPAEAHLYNWTVAIPSGSPTVTGSGTLTTGDTIVTGWDGGFTGYLVTGITGTYAGLGITGLAAVNSYLGNDNLVNASAPYLDIDGIAFTLSGSLYGDDTVGLYYDSGAGGYTDTGLGNGYGDFTLTDVPEPTSFVLLGVALVALGWAHSRRRHAR